MTNILDRVAESSRPFVPITPIQFLALQIARHVGALRHAREYAVLLEHYPERLILKVLRLCAERKDMSHDSFLAAFRATIHQLEP
jgi:hypothetical protein